MNRYLREFLIWMVSIGIALVLWYPIFTKVSYFRLGNGVLQIVLIIQLFRWFVFYEDVVILKRGWMKAIFILVLFTTTAILYIEGLDSIRLFENQSLADVGKVNGKLGMQEVYDLFAYLKQLTLICSLGLLGATAMMILKIFYRTLGYGNPKVRKFLGK